MSPDPAGFVSTLEQICTDVIGPDAVAVDRQGAFPERGLKALSAAGLMGAVSAPEVGGLGLGFRGAATIVGRLAQECGSTAMVVCMLMQDMDDGRRKRLVRLGFPDTEAAALSALHTRNFM